MLAGVGEEPSTPQNEGDANAEGEYLGFLFPSFSHSIRAVSWVLVSQAGEQMRKGGKILLLGCLMGFAFRPLGCLIGFAPSSLSPHFVAVLRQPNPLEADERDPP